MTREFFQLTPDPDIDPWVQGEVRQHFMHAVTGEANYMVDFAGFLGVRSVPVNNCYRVEADAAGPSKMRSSSNEAFCTPLPRSLAEYAVAADLIVPPLREVPDEVTPPDNPDSQQSRQYVFPPYLGFNARTWDNLADEGGQSDVEDEEWRARFGDFGSSSDSGNSDWDDEGFFDDRDVVLNPEEDLGFENNEFFHRYNDVHWQEVEGTLLGNRNNFPVLLQEQN